MLRVVPELEERSAGVDARLLGARTVMAQRRLGLRVELGARRGGSWWWSLPVHCAARGRHMCASEIISQARCARCRVCEWRGGIVEVDRS